MLKRWFKSPLAVARGWWPDARSVHGERRTKERQGKAAERRLPATTRRAWPRARRTAEPASATTAARNPPREAVSRTATRPSGQKPERQQARGPAALAVDQKRGERKAEIEKAGDFVGVLAVGGKADLAGGDGFRRAEGSQREQRPAPTSRPRWRAAERADRRECRQTPTPARRSSSPGSRRGFSRGSRRDRWSRNRNSRTRDRARA